MDSITKWTIRHFARIATRILLGCVIIARSPLSRKWWSLGGKISIKNACIARNAMGTIFQRISTMKKRTKYTMRRVTRRVFMRNVHYARTFVKMSTRQSKAR